MARSQIDDLAELARWQRAFSGFTPEQVEKAVDVLTNKLEDSTVYLTMGTRVIADYQKRIADLEGQVREAERVLRANSAYIDRLNSDHADELRKVRANADMLAQSPQSLSALTSDMGESIVRQERQIKKLQWQVEDLTALKVKYAGRILDLEKTIDRIVAARGHIRQRMVFENTSFSERPVCILCKQFLRAENEPHSHATNCPLYGYTSQETGQ